MESVQTDILSLSEQVICLKKGDREKLTQSAYSSKQTQSQNITFKLWN